MVEQIKAKLIGLSVGGFKSEADKEAFDVLVDAMFSMSNGIVITPFYSDEGELMSFIVDSKKASKIIDKKGGK